MSRRLSPHPVLDVIQWEQVTKDDFESYTNTQLWTALAADSGASVAIATGANMVGGAILLTTGAVDNNEAGTWTTNEFLSMLLDRPFAVEAMIKFTEANTDDANVCFGVADAPGANWLSDNGGGDNINNTGAVIFKVDGETSWRAASNVNAGTVKEHQSTKTSTSTTWQRLRIEVNPVATAQCEISYFVNNHQLILADTSVKSPQLIKHTWDITTVTEMDLGIYLKAGGTNSETCLVDYIAWGFLRKAQG